jgi:PPP family 3-phenylpropionic acid transporter
MPSHIRLALYFALYFVAYGILTPYWPVWLRDKGFEPNAIGLVLAAGMVAKTIGLPVFTGIADRLGRRRIIILVLACLTTVTTGSLAFLPGFWPVLIACALVTALSAGCVSLSDNIALLRARREAFTYSRARMWGSISFLIITQFFGAYVLPVFGPQSILWGVMIGFALGAAATKLLPETAEEIPVQTPNQKRTSSWRVLLTHKPLVRLYLATALLQNAHLFYYGYGSLHWRDAGLSDKLIGFLWAEGVLAEVLLFALAPKFLWARQSSRLFLLVVIGGLIRWTVLATTTDPTALVMVNWLHAFTFGACHLATMAELTERAPPGYSASAQGFYAAFSNGLVAAIVYMASGPIFSAAGQYTFYIPALMSLAGGLVIFWPSKPRPAA